MWLKFIILMLVAIVNIVLGFIIQKRNNNKDKARLYFSLMCFSAGLWSISIGLSLYIKDSYIYLINARVFYFFATLIFLLFLFFSINLFYKYQFKLLNCLMFLFSVLIFFFIFSNIFLIDTYVDSYAMHEIENKFLHLFYGIYILILLFYSYYILFHKYFKAQGINKKMIFFVILITIIPFILGSYFDWYMPYINRHYLDWLGPIFTMIMNVSMFYLFFHKRTNE